MDEEIAKIRERIAVLEEKAAEHDRQLQSKQWIVATVIAAASAFIGLLAFLGVHA